MGRQGADNGEAVFLLPASERVIIAGETFTCVSSLVQSGCMSAAIVRLLLSARIHSKETTPLPLLTLLLNQKKINNKKKKCRAASWSGMPTCARYSCTAACLGTCTYQRRCWRFGARLEAYGIYEMMKHVETREKARAIMSGNGEGHSVNDQKWHHVDNIGQVMTESSIERTDSCKLAPRLGTGGLSMLVHVYLHSWIYKRTHSLETSSSSFLSLTRARAYTHTHTCG